MMGKLAVALVVFGAVLAPIKSAQATVTDDARACAAAVATTRIAACTALINETHLDSTNLSAVYFNRGNAFSETGKSELAIADYDKALSLHPDFVDALLNRGAAKARHRDFDGAIADYSAVLKQQPNDRKTIINRAIVRGNMHDYRGALADFGVAAQLAPDSSDAFSGLCWIHAVSGLAPNTGLNTCSRAVALRPEDSAVLGYRALLAFRLGDFDMAIVDYDQALAKNSNNATFLYGRGMAKLREGNPTGANEDIAAAKALDARIVQTFMGYGIAP
jgi:tetratricopeptide (TPR) repeat protein